MFTGKIIDQEYTNNNKLIAEAKQTQIKEWLWLGIKVFLMKMCLQLPMWLGFIILLLLIKLIF